MNPYTAALYHLARERTRVAELCYARERAEFYASLATPCVGHWLELALELTGDIDAGRMEIVRIEIEVEALSRAKHQT